MVHLSIAARRRSYICRNYRGQAATPTSPDKSPTGNNGLNFGVVRLTG